MQSPSSASLWLAAHCDDPCEPSVLAPDVRRVVMTQPLSLEAEEFLSWLTVERGRSSNTVVSYRRDLVGWEQWLCTIDATPDKVEAGDLEAYLTLKRDEGKSAATITRNLATLRGFYRFLYEEGTIAADPTADLQSPRLAKRLPKALDESQTLALINAVTGEEPLDYRDRALLELLYGTGARISEVVGLSLPDVHFDDGLVRVFGKGSKERLVPLGRASTGALLAWLSPAGRPRIAPERWARRDDAEAVFLNTRGGRLSRQGAWMVLKRHAERVGLHDQVSPHVLRHSCASHMLAHGADIRVVQELLGHVSIATTQMYTRLSTEHLRTAYEGAHPRAGHEQDK